MPSKYTQIDQVAVNYLHTGRSTLPDVTPRLDNGALLLFVHGAGSNAHAWSHQLDHFGRQHSAVAFDFPGHGCSAGTEGLSDFGAYVQVLESFVERLALRPFVLVGVAMGGAIALTFALRHPERVRALVLVATPLRFTVPAESLDVWRDVTRGRKAQPFSTEFFSPSTDLAIMREVWTEQVKTDPRVRYADLLACDGVDFSGRLADLRVPTLVVAGRDDVLVPPAAAEELRDQIQDAELKVIDNAGHAVAAEQALQFNASIDDFLSRLRA